jgi:preprotein translocase subunit SecE
MNLAQRRAIEAECARLPTAYAVFIDFRRFDELCDLFTEGAVLNLDGWPFEGREAIRTYMHSRPKTRTTRHAVSNILIEVQDEMTKVVWPKTGELWRSTLVVAVGIALIGSILNSGYRSSVASATAGLPDELAGPVEEGIGGALAVSAQLGADGEPILVAAREAFVDGWQTSTKEIRDFDKLPKKARIYLQKLAQLTGSRLSIVSVGARRAETIVL